MKGFGYTFSSFPVVEIVFMLFLTEGLFVYVDSPCGFCTPTPIHSWEASLSPSLEHCQLGYEKVRIQLSDNLGGWGEAYLVY